MKNYVEVLDKYVVEILLNEYAIITSNIEHLDECMTSLAIASATCYDSDVLFDRFQTIYTHKIEYINLKLLLDQCISKVKLIYQPIIWAKIKSPTLSMKDLQYLLHLSERTAFRHIEKAYLEIVNIAMSSHLDKKILYIFNNLKVLRCQYEDVKDRRNSYMSKRNVRR